MLALGVMLLVAIDLIILTIYTGVEGTRGNLSAQRVPNRENPEDVSGVNLLHYTCSIRCLYHDGYRVLYVICIGTRCHYKVLHLRV